MSEVFSFIQYREDINDIVAVQVDFLDYHSSGNGNIGRTTLYKAKEN